MEDVNLGTLGNRVAYLVSIAQIDLAAVDALAGLTEGHTGQIARGSVVNPTSKTLASIARVLGASVDWLLDDSKDAAAIRKAAPSQRRVRAAIVTARGVHDAKVAASKQPRKAVARSAGRARQARSDAQSTRRPAKTGRSRGAR